MASRLEAVWNAIKALYEADTTAGGLAESSGSNRLFEFLWRPGTTRAINVPSVYVEIQSQNADTFATTAESFLVRMHLYTDVHGDVDMSGQGGIAERMATVFHRVTPATIDGKTFSRLWKIREFNAASTDDQVHLVQEYLITAS